MAPALDRAGGGGAGARAATITDAQIAELKANAETINFEDAERREREVRHDVMAHVHAYGLQASSAKGIIHLGATSAFVTDNTDILQMAEGLRIIRRRMVNLMAKLRDFAWQWRATPTLGIHALPARASSRMWFPGEKPSAILEVTRLAGEVLGDGGARPVDHRLLEGLARGLSSRRIWSCSRAISKRPPPVIIDTSHTRGATKVGSMAIASSRCWRPPGSCR